MKREECVNRILICIAVGIILIMHMYMLTSVPYGINIDEAGSCYDAWCLAHYGVDRYGNSYPLYFHNYGGGQSPLFNYLLVICFKFVDYSLWVPRLLMLGACLITAFYGYRFTNLIKANEKEEHNYFGILFLFLFAVSPIFIMIFRIGMDSTWLIPTSTMFLFYFTKAIKQERKKDYIIAGVVGGIVLYSYVLSYVVMPIMLVLSFLYTMRIRRKQYKPCFLNWVFLAIPLGLLALPLILIQIINIFNLPEMYFWKFTFTKLDGYRGNEISLEQFGEQILDAFQYTHFFDALPYNTIPEYGTFYYISIPFIIFGALSCFKKVISSIREDYISLECVPISWCIAEYVLGGMIGGGSEPYSSRMVGIFVVLCYFGITGLREVYIFLKSRIIDVRVCKVFATTCIITYTVLFALFARYYFRDYTKDKYPLLNLFCYDVSPVIEWFENDGARYANMKTYSSMRYIYYVLASGISPYELHFSDGEPEVINNVQLYYPEEIGYDGNYIVRMDENESREHLKENGFREIKLKNWCILLNPLADMQIEQKEVKDVEYYIDKVGIEEERCVIQGWAYKKGTKECCDKIGVNIGNRFFEAQLEERPDVVQIHKLDDTKMYGFKCAVDVDELQTVERFDIVCNGKILLEIEK